MGFSMISSKRVLCFMYFALRYPFSLNYSMVLKHLPCYNPLKISSDFFLHSPYSSKNPPILLDELL